MNESLYLKSENRNLKTGQSNLGFLFSDLSFKDSSDFDFSIFRFRSYGPGYAVPSVSVLMTDKSILYASEYSVG